MLETYFGKDDVARVFAEYDAAPEELARIEK
jgi:hypothetical protein